MNRPKIFKFILSVFIIFHLICVFILPNPDGILYRQFAPVVVTYGSFFGFNTTWRFFSPNPLIRIMQYEVFSRNEDGNLVGQIFQYPRSLEEEGSRENFNRKLTNSMFMMMREEYMRDILGPKICSWHPGAEIISFSMRGRVLPSIEKSKFMGSVREEISEIQTQHLTDVNCSRELEE